MRFELVQIVVMTFNVLTLGYFLIQVLSVRWIRNEREHTFCPGCLRWVPTDVMRLHRPTHEPEASIAHMIALDDGLGEDYIGHFRVVPKLEIDIARAMVVLARWCQFMGLYERPTLSSISVKSGDVIYLIQGGKK